MTSSRERASSRNRGSLLLWQFVIGSAFMVFLMSGCSGKDVAPSANPSVKTPPAAAGAACAESPRMLPDRAMKGSAQGGELWALGGQPRVGEDFKLVVRVTGSGEVSAVAVSPNGSRHDPTATRKHLSSNFDRPGDEWGLFFLFNEPGCWRIVVERAGLKGSITLAVVSA